MATATERALTMADLRRRWATSPARIREMIRSGVLRAIDVGVCGKRHGYRFTAAAVAEAEHALAVRPAAKANRTPKPRVSEETRQALGG